MADATDKTDSEIENSPESIKDEQKDSKQKKDEIAITPQSHPANTSNQGNKIDDVASNGINTVTSNSKIDEQKTQKQEEDKIAETPKANPNNTSKQGNKINNVASNGINADTSKSEIDAQKDSKQEKDKNSETPKANPNNTSKQGNKSDDVASNGTKSDIPKTNPNNKQYGNVWHDTQKPFLAMIVILAIALAIVSIVRIGNTPQNKNAHSHVVSIHDSEYSHVVSIHDSEISLNSQPEKVTITFQSSEYEKVNMPITIHKGEKLGKNKYLKLENQPFAQFSHWEKGNGEKITEDTKFEESCILYAVWIKCGVTIHFFKTLSGESYQDITINKGGTLGSKYWKPEHQSSKFDYWKFFNGDILTANTKIEEDCTVYAVWIDPITVHFVDTYSGHRDIKIFKGESLGEQYFEPKSPSAQFSHWDLNGTPLTKDTKIYNNCTVNAVWIEKVTIHFKAQQKGLYDQDITINKGGTLGDKYYTQRHPLFQFVCWKDRNGQIVTQDTKIDKESTLYAEYKLNPAYKKLYVYNKGIFDIIKVQSNFETNSLEILTTSGEWISEDITSLYGVIYKNDKYVYYDGSSDTLNRKQFQDKLNDAMIPSDCYYIITHDESNCWLPKKLLYYYVLRNKTISFIYPPTKPHEAGDKIEDVNPNHDQTWTRHPFCDFDGWYLSDGTKLTKETVITQDCTVRAQWKFAYLAMKVKVKEKIIYQEPAIDSKCISDYSNTQSENNEVIIVDVKQNNKKEEWGKLQSGGWIQLAQVTTILATQYKNGTWKEKKKYLIHFNLGKENGLGDSIVAVPHGKTIKEAYNYGDTYCLSEPQRLGYRFAGCYYHGKEIGYDTKIEEEYDEPIIAKWIAE
jgi:hypothetical protein